MSVAVSELPPLRVAHTDAIDLDAAEAAVGDLLAALGQPSTDGHLAETPRRVAHAYAELLTPRDFDLTTFPNDEHYDELVLARDIPFQSPASSKCSAAGSRCRNA
jgi:GTP cyclohydrolase IA